MEKLPKVLADSGVMMGTLLLIIVLAIAFNKFLAEQYIPQNAAALDASSCQQQMAIFDFGQYLLVGIGLCDGNHFSHFDCCPPSRSHCNELRNSSAPFWHYVYC